LGPEACENSCVDKIIRMGTVYQEFLSGRFPNTRSYLPPVTTGGRYDLIRSTRWPKIPSNLQPLSTRPIKTQSKTTKLGNVRRLLGGISSAAFTGLVGEWTSAKNTMTHGHVTLSLSGNLKVFQVDRAKTVNERQHHHHVASMSFRESHNHMAIPSVASTPKVQQTSLRYKR
jgi:hypothetical protein